MSGFTSSDLECLRAMVSRSISWWRECFVGGCVDPLLFRGVPGEPDLRAEQVVAEIRRLQGLLSRFPS